MATTVETLHTQRARYYSSADGFNLKLPPVPAHVFGAERDRALDPAASTGLIPLDLSGALGTGFPATTPLILARYAPIRRGDRLTTRFAATGELCYVIEGAGETVCGGDTVAWESGDVFCLPGGHAVTHAAGAAGGCLLWIVTNEPQRAFEGSPPPAPGRAPLEVVHYPAGEIRRQLERVHRLPPDKTMTGKAVTFGQAAREGQRTCLPSLTLALNSLPPHESQRAHRHNAAAVTLIVQGSRCHSMVGGTRVDWQDHAVMITPPGDVHSHHNEGDSLALFLIVQDGGLYYHCRTMGFSYA